VQNQTSPLILSFGVSDPVGAIGIQADLATYCALGCHGLTVTTALLIGDTARVEDMQEIDPDWVSDQARVLLEDMAVDAVKVGALGGIEHVVAIAEIISDYPDLPLVLDPFVSGLPQQGLDSEEILTAVRQLLIPQTTLLMLSEVELERLAETWRDSDPADTLQADIDHLLELGCEYVLVTGRREPNSGDNAQRANTLFSADGVVRHDPWHHLTGSYNGAGGTLSAAIAAYLAQSCHAGHGGEDCNPEVAVGLAQQYTAGALVHARRFGMGKLVPDRFFQLNFQMNAGAAPAA
jgi:hydroxymethylpyrimidine/phosphomethylpyrimidine kinase